MNYTDSASRIWLSDCSKLAINWKNINDVTIFRHDVIVKFFWRCFTSLVKFSYWYEFHVNFITGSGVMTISFNMRLTRNLEIPPSEFCPISGDWDEVGIPNLAFGTSLSNKMLLNAAKCQRYSFHRFWVIKGKPIGRGGGDYTSSPSPLRLGLITTQSSFFCQTIKIILIFSPVRTA